MNYAIVPSSPELLELLGEVERVVHARTGGRIRGLRICVTEGRLVVSGQTSSYYNKQLATHAVLDTVDDINVQNEVEVC